MFEVYIHVPFCLRRCGYCDFNTYTAVDLGGGASRGNYAAMTIREMRLVRDWQERHGIAEPPASTVFFGGGTPTVLSADDLIAILNAIRTLWGIEEGAEITTEANPDTVDETTIRPLADGGFTRISFGMQSAVPHVLRTLDRTHTPAHVDAGVRAAEAAGLRSVDLIYGAPGESLNDWRTTRAHGDRPGCEPPVRVRADRGTDDQDGPADRRRRAAETGRRRRGGEIRDRRRDGSAAGLEWYEISNWAAPGYESRHNLGYWRNVDWAGIGPGAHSHYNRVEPASCRSESERSARPEGRPVRTRRPWRHPFLGSGPPTAVGRTRSTTDRCRGPTTNRSPDGGP